MFNITKPREIVFRDSLIAKNGSAYHPGNGVRRCFEKASVSLTTAPLHRIMVDMGVVRLNNEEKILEMLSGMQGQINGIQGQLSGMQGQINGIQGQINGIQGQINGMQSDISNMKNDIKKLNSRVDTIDEKLDDLIEEHSMTREGVNKLLGWADAVGPIVRYPLEKAR